MFSEKYGYKSEKQIQHECISDVLRKRIWNLFYQWEIQDGGLSSERVNAAFTGKQTIEAKICDRLGFIVNGTVSKCIYLVVFIYIYSITSIIPIYYIRF